MVGAFHAVVVAVRMKRACSDLVDAEEGTQCLVKTRPEFLAVSRKEDRGAGPQRGVGCAVGGNLGGDDSVHVHAAAEMVGEQENIAVTPCGDGEGTEL